MICEEMTFNVKILNIKCCPLQSKIEMEKKLPQNSEVRKVLRYFMILDDFCFYEENNFESSLI